MKKGLLALMVVSGMTLMTACSGSSQTETTTAAQTAAKEETSQTERAGSKEAEESKAERAGGKVYGYITPGPDTWYQRNVEGFQRGAEKDGNKVVILNSDYDVSKEVSNIDSMINQGVDGLCIFSFNESGAKIAAEKCAKAGIGSVVCAVCKPCPHSCLDLFAGLAGVHLVQNIQEWGKFAFSVEGVHIVVDRNVADAFAWEVDFGFQPPELGCKTARNTQLFIINLLNRKICRWFHYKKVIPTFLIYFHRKTVYSTGIPDNHNVGISGVEGGLIIPLSDLQVLKTRKS